MNLLDLIDPEDLTGWGREALADFERNQFTLSRYFPAQQTSDIVVSFGTGGGGLARTAKFRAYDTEPPVGQRETVERKTTEIPTIAEKLFLSEYQRYRLMNNTDEAVQAVYDDTTTLMRSIAARLEVARGRALVDGALTFNENGLINLNMDFGRDAGHSVSTGTTWAAHASADPLADLVSWMDTYIDTNGFAPGSILTSSTVLSHLLQNDALLGQMYVMGSPTVPSRLTLEGLATHLAGYGVPPIVTNDAKVSVDGSATRVIDEDKLIFLPPDEGAAGATVWGTTLEAQEALNLTGSEQPGVVAFLEKTTQTPIQYWTAAAARAVPVLGNPDLTFVADVIL